MEGEVAIYVRVGVWILIGLGVVFSFLSAYYSKDGNY